MGRVANAVGRSAAELSLVGTASHEFSERSLTFDKITRHSSAVLAGDVVQCLYYPIYIIGSHGRVDRERYRTIEALFRIRELPGAISEFVLIERVQVKRDEVDGGSDTALPQLLNYTIAIDPER